MSDEMFQQAVQAAKAGQPARAKDLLTRLIKADATRVEYWLWMSAVVETEKEKIFCLQNAIKLDPNSVGAKRGLVTLGVMRPEEAGLAIALPAVEEGSVELPRASASAQTNAFDRALMALPGGAFNRPRNRMIAAFALVGLGLAALFMCVAFALPPLLNALRPRQVASVATATPTPSPSPTATETATEAPTQTTSACKIPDSPVPGTPLAVYLCIEQTPTPQPLSPFLEEPREAFTKLQLAYFAQDWPKVINDGPGALSELPDNARVHFYIAEAYRHGGDTKNALKYYRSSIARDSTFAPAHWGKATMDIAQGLNTDALNDWNNALNADPSFVPAYLDRAAYYSANRLWDRALADLQKAQTVAPTNALVLIHLAETYLDAGQPDLVAPLLDQALAVDPGIAYLYYVRGRLEYVQGAFAAAATDLAIAYPYVITQDAVYPSLYQAQVYYAVGAAKAAMGDDAAALSLLTQAVTVYKSGYPQANVVRGNLYLRAQDFQSARDDFNTAISQFVSRDPNNPALTDAYVGNGLALLGLNRPDSAISNFQVAANAAPGNFQAQLGVGQSAVLIGGPRNAETAVAALTQALTLTRVETETAQVLFWRAQAYQTLGSAAEEAADWAALNALADAPAGYGPTAAARLTEISAASVTATLTATATPKVNVATATATPKVKVVTPTSTPKGKAATATVTVTVKAPDQTTPTPSRVSVGPTSTATPTATRRAYP